MTHDFARLRLMHLPPGSRRERLIRRQAFVDRIRQGPMAWRIPWLSPKIDTACCWYLKRHGTSGILEGIAQEAR